jgi:hypothetical protein
MKLSTVLVPVLASTLMLSGAHINAAEPTSVTPTALAPTSVALTAAEIDRGEWTGEFLQIDWTFAFDRNGEGWSGRYMTSKGKKWHPLRDVVITDRSTTFSIDSKPGLRFTLKLDDSNAAMSGGVTIEGVATAPFSATRSL